MRTLGLTLIMLSLAACANSPEPGIHYDYDDFASFSGSGQAYGVSYNPGYSHSGGSGGPYLFLNDTLSLMDEGDFWRKVPGGWREYMRNSIYVGVSPPTPQSHKSIVLVELAEGESTDRLGSFVIDNDELLIKDLPGDDQVKHEVAWSPSERYAILATGYWGEGADASGLIIIDTDQRRAGAVDLPEVNEEDQYCIQRSINFDNFMWRTDEVAFQIETNASEYSPECEGPFPIMTVRLDLSTLMLTIDEADSSHTVKESVAAAETGSPESSAGEEYDLGTREGAVRAIHHTLISNDRNGFRILVSTNQINAIGDDFDRWFNAWREMALQTPVEEWAMVSDEVELVYERGGWRLNEN